MLVSLRSRASRAARQTITSRAKLWLVRDRQTLARDRDRDSGAMSEYDKKAENDDDGRWRYVSLD